MEATIIVQYVNQPMAGKKQGNVKTPDGVIYGVDPGMLSIFSPGQSYVVQYEDRVWNGKTYHTIKSATPTGAQSPAQGGAGGAASRSKYGSTDDATAERIFVCGALNAFITNGRIEPNAAAVISAVKALRAAWSDTFGKPKTAGQAATDDEIPF